MLQLRFWLEDGSMARRIIRELKVFDEIQDNHCRFPYILYHNFVAKYLNHPPTNKRREIF